MRFNIIDFKTPSSGLKPELHGTFSISEQIRVSSWNFYHAPLTFYLPINWYLSSVNLEFGRTGVRTLNQYSSIARLTKVYFPGSFIAVNFSASKTVVLTVTQLGLFPIINFLKNSTFFNFLALTDIWATDFPSRKNRFELTYSLLSNKRNTRLYVKTFVNEWDVVPSVTALFDSAAWLEREVWDMFGIPFSGHSDLRRILTDYGFFGFPLRKDFPLTGFSELRYDDTTRRVASEHLNLIQELRLFFFSTPWKKK